MKNLVYFSAADRQMESFIDEGAFEQSLLLNVLFQQGVLAPDILLAISGHVERHLNNPSLTLMEAAIEEGLVVPSFRAGTSSFTDALREIRRQKIVGVRTSAEETMTRLQRAAERSSKFQPFSPSTHLGVTFDERLRLLQESFPPDLGPSFGMTNTQELIGKFWPLTERWRTHCIDEARKATRGETGEMGIRRGEIVRAVARDLEGGSSQDIEDVATLFQAFPEKPELRVFFRWICEIYGYNQAIGMDSVPNFPCYNALSSVSLMAGTQPSPPANHRAFSSISETVKFPPLAVLKEKSAKEILAIRTERGVQYLQHLDEWIADPESTTRESNLRDSLKRYALDVVKFSRPPESSLLDVTVSRLPTGTKFPIVAGAGAVLERLNSSHPGAGFLLGGGFCVVAEGGYALYRFTKNWPEKQNVTISAENRIADLEVNVPKPQESQSRDHPEKRQGRAIELRSTPNR